MTFFLGLGIELQLRVGSGCAALGRHVVGRGRAPHIELMRAGGFEIGAMAGGEVPGHGDARCHYQARDRRTQDAGYFHSLDTHTGPEGPSSIAIDPLPTHTIYKAEAFVMRVTASCWRGS